MRQEIFSAEGHTSRTFCRERLKEAGLPLSAPGAAPQTVTASASDVKPPWAGWIHRGR